MAYPGRIGDEAPALGVFQKATGEPWVQGIGARHRGGEVVDDQILGDAAEEVPGRLQAGDDLFQLLAVGGPQEAVPGMGQHLSRVNHNCRFGVNQFCRFTSSAWPRCWAASVR